MNMIEALQAVSDYCPNLYAKAYARAALDMHPGNPALSVQVLYVLSNTAHWRGDLAREVKRVLREAGTTTGSQNPYATL